MNPTTTDAPPPTDQQAAPVLGGAVTQPPVATPAPETTAAPTTPATPTPEQVLKGWHEQVIGPDGKFVDAWQDKLPDDFAEDRALLGRFGDLKTLVKTLKDNMATARAKTDGLVKVPGQDATPEERAAYFKAIGVPDDPKGYGIKPPEKLPEGVTWDNGMSEKFASKAHEIGLTPAQVAALQEWQLSYVGEQSAAPRQALASQMEAEKQELNRAFGASLPKAVDHAQRLAKQEGLKPDIFDPNSPDFWGVEALAFASRVASKLGEDKLIPGAAVRNLSGSALGRDIVTNPQNPHYARYQAGDPEITAMVRELYKQG